MRSNILTENMKQKHEHIYYQVHETGHNMKYLLHPFPIKQLL